MNSLRLTNARLVLADEIIEGSLTVENGIMTGIDGKASITAADDVEGDFLIPGLIELHTDHLEGHFRPRPGVEWPAVPAVIAHDAQIAAAGITTVFDALRAGTFDIDDGGTRNAELLACGIKAAQENQQLRAEHFIHLRCEIPCADTVESAQRALAVSDVSLISIMDHTPGARQFTSIDKFRDYYLGKNLIAPDKIDAYIAEKLEFQQRHAAVNKAGVLDIARRIGIRLASHDDATAAHVGEAVSDGAAIAEFPTTAEAAHAAHANGLAVMMGAPNLVRGGSHSGNISTAEVAASGHLNILSSDYVPASLLLAAFTLPQVVKTITLPRAISFVTSGPAHAVGLDDRGEIAIGKRADLVQVRMHNGHPLVRRVWREGIRVL
jgi:alpha-D-ribose 1-methylphosphonate 5-triphosphate diphosphatase